MKRHWILWLFVTIMCACSSEEEREKFQSSRDNIVNVKEQIKEMETGNVLIGNRSWPYYSKDYLVLMDFEAWEGAIHLFDNKDFRYLSSVGKKGEGPDELTNMGGVYFNEKQRKIYVADYSKYKIFSYDMDSIIAMPKTYKHQEKAKISNSQFPTNVIYINDTLSYGRIIKPTSYNSFDQMICKWNMLTGDLKVIGEKHPDTYKKRSMIDVSMEKKMLVEVYSNYDLMNISDLDGNIQCYIYGPDWATKGLETFNDVMITSNHILASYSGDEWAKGRTDKIHVFDLKGNYIKTLDIGYNIRICCYDSTNHRLFMVFNDEIQFGYIDLKGII